MLFFALGRLGHIFHSYPLTGIGGVGWFGMGVLQDADKSVMDGSACGYFTALKRRTDNIANTVGHIFYPCEGKVFDI